MYYVMDAHSFFSFIYFILLIVIGSFFMINLCLVVIATQFSETKQREQRLMEEARLKFMSNDSTLASYQEWVNINGLTKLTRIILRITPTKPPGSMYTELIRLAEYSWKKLMKKMNA